MRNLDNFRFGVPGLFRDLMLPEEFGISHLTRAFRCDIQRLEDKVVVECELPGFKKEEIEISYEDKVLTVSAKKDEKTEENKNENSYIIKERHTQSVSRSFIVENIDEENIKAKYEDGILVVTLNKKLPEKVDKKIIID